MVRPKSKKGVSRRSSILKTSMVQQPLQNVQANVSLHQETSITIKQKRRVSFADKKHIKEFCDSVEQGTLWDVTYEESSSENSGQINLYNQPSKTINNDHQNINDEWVTSENLNSMNISLDFTEPISTIGSLKSMCVEETSIENSRPTLCQIANKTKRNNNILIESNVNIDICVDKSIVVYNDTSNLNDIDNAKLNKTCAQDVSMEITEIPYIIKSRGILPMVHKQLFEDKENVPMSNIISTSNALSILQNKIDKVSDKTQYFCAEQLEFTECLQSVIKPAEFQASLSKITSVTNDEEDTKTQIFQDLPMEMTCVIPLIDKTNFIDRTIIFQDVSMDNTMELTSITNKNEGANPIDMSEVENNRTNLLNASMEITNKICSLPHSKTVDVTTDPMDTLNYGHSSVHYNKNTQSNNDTMEFTIAAANIPPISESNKYTILGQNRLSSESTKIFQNESIDITEPLHIPKIVCNNDIQPVNDISTNSLMNNEDVMLSRTQIFQDESMAITEYLHIPKNVVNDEPINLLRNTEDTTSLNTRIFENMPMEITNVITNLPILPNSSKLCENTEEDSVNSNIDRKNDETIVNNKRISGIVNATTDSCTTNYIEDSDDSSTEFKPVNALTSLISSFVYADMIEDDSFIKAINENELQSMKDNIEQEIKYQQNNINTNSAVDIVNVNMENVQSSEKCFVRNEEIIREHESYIEYHHEDNNIQETNVTINREENNQCNPKLFLSESIEINEDAFEKNINHKTVCDISTKVDMIRSNIQLNETKKDIESNSATYIIKPKKNSVMDIDKYTDDRSSRNQINNTLSILSPTLLSASSKNEMPIAENNLITNLTGNINLNNFCEKENYNNSSLNEDLEHVTSHEKPKESSTFSSLVQQLKMYMGSNDCIWDLYFEDIDKQMLVISFISTSLLIVIFTQNDVTTATCPIKHIDIISRLENDENVQLSIAHKLIKEKINVKYVNQLYKYNEGFVPLLSHISEDVKLVLDFIFDLKQLDDINLMEIDTERITFIARSKYMNIILEVTVDVKLFDEIDSTNINIVCILGTVRKEDIKDLIKNIKRDYKFLRRFMSDIKDYIDIIEQANLVN